MPEGTMRALWYNSVRAFTCIVDGLRSSRFGMDQPRDFEIKQVPIPKCGDDDVLLKGRFQVSFLRNKWSTLLISWLFYKCHAVVFVVQMLTFMRGNSSQSFR